ncbi:hypothetical protein [Bacillus xiapuensis]|uniref:Uncharacterized protein n=1 Tax=Bacillus xiapuensis TaxID=2014075 RepID=A0ABU6N832_9BACI|nr:hypothetical protein [Bacillus xiapuensis]
MKILKITDEVFETYRTQVNGKENITRDQAERRLTRNVMEGMSVPPRSFLEALIGNEKYIFGNLHIIVRHGRVVRLFNHKGGKPYGGWYKDQKKHAELTKQLGII